MWRVPQKQTQAAGDLWGQPGPRGSLCLQVPFLPGPEPFRPNTAHARWAAEKGRQDSENAAPCGSGPPHQSMAEGSSQPGGLAQDVHPQPPPRGTSQATQAGVSTSTDLPTPYPRFRAPAENRFVTSKVTDLSLSKAMPRPPLGPASQECPRGQPMAWGCSRGPVPPPRWARHTSRAQHGSEARSEALPTWGRRSPFPVQSWHPRHPPHAPPVPRRPF